MHNRSQWRWEYSELETPIVALENTFPLLASRDTIRSWNVELFFIVNFMR